MKNKMEIEFMSQSVNEAFARAAVGAFVSQLDPTVDQLYDIKTAVSEAVTNSIVHGYHKEKTHQVKVTCKYEGRRVEIEVIDKGIGIKDIEEAMTLLYTSSPEDERAGLGFTVMESVMDEITVQSSVGEGTVVKMVKEIDEV